MKKNSFLTVIILLFAGLACNSQDILDFGHTIVFANYLYKKGNFEHAIIEYQRAWLSGNLSVRSQTELFQSYLKTQKVGEGINLYRNKYPSLLANNDTLELLYGKLLISSQSFNDLSYLLEKSKSLSEEQSLFLSLSSDLIQQNWSNTFQNKSEILNYSTLSNYYQIIHEINFINYKSPCLSIAMSAIVPGMGKVYSGYWKEGLTSFTIIFITAFQAYRGFSRYGSKPYSWIYASLSASFYLSNLYGSYKAASRNNYEKRHRIKNEIEKAFDQMYTY
jgi:hypothetical protein